MHRGMFPPDRVRELLLTAFPDADLELTDLTGTRDHYDLTITSRAFLGKTTIEQHRLVYAALGDAMQGPIHALALHTRAAAPPEDAT